MPAPVTDAAWTVTSDQTALIVVGGEANSDPVDTIYKFECESQVCSWTLFERKLAGPKEEAVTMFIPDFMVSCNSNGMKATTTKAKAAPPNRCFNCQNIQHTQFTIFLL